MIETFLPENKQNEYKGPYALEQKTIISEIGDIETIRKTLGLSRRKICKLLLVDPSSWTRWSKEGHHAPPYIYRSLQWCLAIMEKYPEAHPLVRSLTYEKENKVDQLSKKIEEKMSLHRSISFEVHNDVENLKKMNLELIKSNQKLMRFIYILGGLIVTTLTISFILRT